ncbi:MAG TPA: aminotransferase class IV, partial [Bdellovibrionota bacterium]|nr:aminotransferase class IV [Bdellovibrionota bacterium]
MQNAIINVNGRILNCDHSAEHAKISVFDRGYLYGDSLYEVTRTYNGKFFLLEEHLQRLEQSAALCRMVLGQSTEHYRLE